MDLMYEHLMIHYVICQLVCVIDSWAHTSFVHSILSLKLGVTTALEEMEMEMQPCHGTHHHRP